MSIFFLGPIPKKAKYVHLPLIDEERQNLSRKYIQVARLYIRYLSFFRMVLSGSDIADEAYEISDGQDGPRSVLPVAAGGTKNGYSTGWKTWRSAARVANNWHPSAANKRQKALDGTVRGFSETGRVVTACWSKTSETPSVCSL